MFKISKVYSDVFVAVFVLCIALLLLVPLPTMLLDFLIAFNIGFSLLLLLIGLSLQNALSLLTFPTLLLLSTLFRLSLNVASTRLILSEGEAGDVIRSFGTFLISGELAVGLIIFLIITVVNFIVIARGASRVSEVSARFVLDSLPGKQMAIDSELRMGTISAEEAKLKREELRKESQLFGSMDGAVKFVQGDAIAGIFITFVNIFGGMYLGIKNGLSFEDAVQTYTMLTVGDGLVTQIPALFISICAGIIVTRVSSGKDSTLGSDLFSQVLKNKKIIYFVSFAILIFGTLPGLPFLPFLLTSLLLIAAGYFIDLSPKSPTPWSVRQVSSENLQIGSSGNLKLDYAKESNLEIFLSENLFNKYGNSKSTLQDWEVLCDQFKDFYGYKLPEFSAKLDRSLLFDEYKIFNRNYEFKKGRINSDCLFASISKEHLSTLGLKVEDVAVDPINKCQVVWVRDSEFLRKLNLESKIQVYEPITFIMYQIISFYQNNPEELISFTEVHLALKEMDNHYPGLFSSIFVNNYINTARITEILKEVYPLGFGINKLKNLLETISVYCMSYATDLVKANEFVLSDIVTFIRNYNLRDTVKAYLNNNSIRAISIDEQILQTLVKNDPYLINSNEFISPIKQLVINLKEKNIDPFVFLVPGKLRAKIDSYFMSFSIEVNVLAYEEVPEGVAIEYIANWSQV